MRIRILNLPFRYVLSTKLNAAQAELKELERMNAVLRTPLEIILAAFVTYIVRLTSHSRSTQAAHQPRRKTSARTHTHMTQTPTCQSNHAQIDLPSPRSTERRRRGAGGGAARAHRGRRSRTGTCYFAPPLALNILVPISFLFPRLVRNSID
jgi:hypothetical protein